MPANKISIKAFNDQRTFKDTVSIDQARSYTIDFSPWAEENNTVTSVNWLVNNGNASITNEALSSNVATALITFSNAENNLIKVTADTGNQKYIVWFDIYVDDPSLDYVNDYSF